MDEPSGWLAPGIEAVEHFFFRVINLVLEGNVRDIRFWLFYLLALSIIWAGCFILVKKMKNGKS